jgi:iron complex outermembrane recepter protein
MAICIKIASDKKSRIVKELMRILFFLAGVSLTAFLANQLRYAPTTSAGEAVKQGVGDIVVTAQKRSESTQRIPVSFQAISGKELAQSGVKDLVQAVTLVPGVVFSRAPDDGLAFTFRGFGTAARPQAFEQSVALFTDGVRRHSYRRWR